MFTGRGGGRVTLPPSCIECLEIWEPQPPGTLWVCNSPLQGFIYRYVDIYIDNKHMILHTHFICSFSLSFLVWLLHTPFRCRGLQLHPITLNDTHTHTHTYLVGLLWKSDRPVTESSTWQHTHIHSNSHDPGGIRTRNSSMRVAAILRLRPRGHWVPL